VPFEGQNAVDTMRQVLKKPVTPLRQRHPAADVTEAAERLILRTLAKEPTDRPQTMGDFLGELQNCYGDEVYRRDVDKIPGAVEAGIMPVAAPPMPAGLQGPGNERPTRPDPEQQTLILPRTLAAELEETKKAGSGSKP
jgi:hypothetical protein